MRRKQEGKKKLKIPKKIGKIRKQKIPKNYRKIVSALQQSIYVTISQFFANKYTILLIIDL